MSSRRNRALPPLVATRVCRVTPSSGPPRAMVARARTSASPSGARSMRTMRSCCQISAAVTSDWSRRTVSTTNMLPTATEVVEQGDRGVVELLGVVDHQHEAGRRPGARRSPGRRPAAGRRWRRSAGRARGAGEPARRTGCRRRCGWPAPTSVVRPAAGGHLEGVGRPGGSCRRRPTPMSTTPPQSGIVDRRRRAGPARRHGRAGAMRFQPRRERRCWPTVVPDRIRRAQRPPTIE